MLKSEKTNYFYDFMAFKRYKSTSKCWDLDWDFYLDKPQKSFIRTRNVSLIWFIRDFVWWPDRGEQKVLVESSPYFCIRQQPIWGLWFCYWFLRPLHWKCGGHTSLGCPIDRGSFFLILQLGHHTDSRMRHKFDLLNNLSYLCGWKYLKNFQREYEWKDA